MGELETRTLLPAPGYMWNMVQSKLAISLIKQA